MTHLAYLSEVCVCVCVCEFYGDPKVDHRLLLIVPGMHVISVHVCTPPQNPPAVRKKLLPFAQGIFNTATAENCLHLCWKPLPLPRKGMIVSHPL